MKSGSILWVEQYATIDASSSPSEKRLEVYQCFPVFTPDKKILDGQNNRIHLERRHIYQIKGSLFWKIWEARRSELPTRYVRVRPDSIFFSKSKQSIGKFVCPTDDGVQTVVVLINEKFEIIDRHDLEFVDDEEGDTMQIVEG